MKKLSLTVLVVGTFLFAGCYADKERKEGATMSGKAGTKTMKCGAGKCGSGKCGGN